MLGRGGPVFYRASPGRLRNFFELNQVNREAGPDFFFPLAVGAASQDAGKPWFPRPIGLSE